MKQQLISRKFWKPVLFNVGFHFKYFVKICYFKQNSGNIIPVLFPNVNLWVCHWLRQNQWAAGRLEGVACGSHFLSVRPAASSAKQQLHKNYSALSCVCPISFATFFTKCTHKIQRLKTLIKDKYMSIAIATDSINFQNQSKPEHNVTVKKKTALSKCSNIPVEICARYSFWNWTRVLLLDNQH